MEIHTWITRAKCNCGYLWTTPGAPNIVCACGALQIIDNVVQGQSETIDEQEFKQAVAQELSIGTEELILDHGSA